MIKEKVLRIYLVFIVVLADTFLGVPWLQCSSILCVLLACFYLARYRSWFNEGFKKARVIAYLFICTIFILDVYHSNDILESLATFVIALSLPLVLSYIKSISSNLNHMLFYFKLFLIYNALFCFLQMSGIYITAGSILTRLGIFGTQSEDFLWLSESQGLRTTGAYTSTIGFACMLGVTTIFFYFMWRMKKNNQSFYYLLLCFVLLITTQTRSALFSVIPSVLIVELFILKKFSFNRVLITVFSTLIFLFAVSLLIPALQEKYPRVFLAIEEDGSVVHRIQANIYGVVGTIEISPFIGLPKRDSKMAMDKGYNQLGLFIGDRYIDEVTQHNQPAYYFRYYGMLGFILFLLLYFRLGTFIFHEGQPVEIQKFILSVLLFHFLYTFSHNNKISNDYFLWIVLGLSLISMKNENRVFTKQI